MPRFFSEISTQSPPILHVWPPAAIHAGHMKKHLRTLLVGVSALIAMGTLSACSGGKTTEATPTSEAVTTPSATATPFPQSARYVADMKAADGKAWFFGNQADGKIDVKSRFRDTLKAEFNGIDVAGDLTMNGVAYKFTAAPVTDVAGMYTADFESVRASWVVRPDGSAIGVQFNTGSISGRDFEQAELQQLNEQQFRNGVRNKRQLQQAAQIEILQNKSVRSTINGHDVTPTLVNGNFRLN